MTAATPVPHGRRWPLRIAALAALALATACGIGEAGPRTVPPTSTPATPTVPTTPDPPSATPPPSTPPASDTPAPVIEALRLELLTDQLAAPLGLTHAGDGSGAPYVTEKAGSVRRVLPPAAGEAAWRVDEPAFLDISDRVSGGGEQGLLGFAFHPEYVSNRRVFAHYTDLNGDTVLAEYRAAPDGIRADPASEVVLLSVDQPYPNHNGGQLAFGPDGYLYLALGDGGSGGDPLGHGQNTETLLGSILRLDVDGGGDAPYAIPSDNPFQAGGGRPEIWVYGLRNPWRFSFDRETGDLYIGDVGQDAWEEIDRQLADSPGGENYGWNIMEATDCLRAEECDRSGLMLPIAEYPQGAGDCTVIGGHVYRGTDVPALAGTYLFGDFCSGRIWGLASEGGSEPRLLAETGLSLSSFGEDEEGELYVLSLEGTLHRVLSAP